MADPTSAPTTSPQQAGPTGSPTVSVIPRSKGQQWRRVATVAVMAIGVILGTIQEMLPEIKSVYGGAHWFPGFVVAIGIGAEVWHRISDASNLTSVSASDSEPTVVSEETDRAIRDSLSPSPERSDDRIGPPSSLMGPVVPGGSDPSSVSEDITGLSTPQVPSQSQGE